MQIIPIQALPNQSLSIPLDGNQWDISIKTTNGTISITLMLNSVLIIENIRAVAGMRVIPAIYEEAGNFAFITTNFEIPDYTKFGNTQQLVYISAAELDLTRVPPPPILTAANFDQNSSLPLRLFPQGYVLAP